MVHHPVGLTAQGVPSAQADHEASVISQSSQGSGSTSAIPHFIALDFADATRTVLYVMAAVMAAVAVVAIVGLQRGVQVESAADPALERST